MYDWLVSMLLSNVLEDLSTGLGGVQIGVLHKSIFHVSRQILDNVSDTLTSNNISTNPDCRPCRYQY
jgi:hypothetical protein